MSALPFVPVEGYRPSPIRGPLSMDTPGLLDAIEQKLEAPRSDCLIWPGAVDRGYGRIYVEGTAKRVHRVVWELKNGPIPDGLTVDHLCRIRSCCNTDHMELVTTGENTRRKPRLFAAPPPADVVIEGGCVNGHKRTPENTRIRIREGRQPCLDCRDCQRERDARRRAKRRAAST